MELSKWQDRWSAAYRWMVGGIGLALAVLLSLASLGFRVFVSMDMVESVTITRNGPLFWAGTALFLLALTLGQRLWSRLSQGKLFLGLALLYLAAGAFLILVCAGEELRADQERIYAYALLFNEGDFNGLRPQKYLGWNPHQLGMLTLERFLLRLWPSVRIVYLMNLLLVVGINFLQWQSTRLLLEGRGAAADRICKNEILLSFLFLPQFLYILFAYGQIPGLFFLEATVCLLLLWLRGARPGPGGRLPWASWLSLVGAALCAALSLLLKPNYGIGIIAVGITLAAVLLAGGGGSEGDHPGMTSESLRRPGSEGRADHPGVRSEGLRRPGRWELSIGILLLVLVAAVARPLLNAAYERETGMEVPGGIPVISYVVMGLQSRSVNANGWFNSYNVDVYTENGFDTAVAAEISRRDLAERAGYLASHAGEAAYFFASKAVSTWCDPLFESVWIGPLPAEGQSVRPQLLRDLYRGQGLYAALAAGMNAFVACIALGAVWALLRLLRLRRFGPGDAASGAENGGMSRGDPRRIPFLLFPALYLTGGFLYHLVSETSSQYVYMYVFCLIPYLAAALEALGRLSISRPTASDLLVAAEGKPRETPCEAMEEGL